MGIKLKDKWQITKMKQGLVLKIKGRFNPYYRYDRGSTLYHFSVINDNDEWAGHINDQEVLAILTKEEYYEETNQRLD